MNHWFSGRAATGSNEIKNSYSETVTLAGNITFAVTFFLFLPSALEKLGIESATSPISSVVSRFLGFLPNLIAAFILIAFGAFLAKLLSRILEKALKATALDSLQKRGNPDNKAGYEFSGIISKIVYALILLVFVVAGIQALGISAISVPATEVVSMIFNYIPLLFVAIILIIRHIRMQKF